MRLVSRSKIGCFIISTILILLFVTGLLWSVFSWEDEFLFINRDSAYNMAETFTLALMQNRAETAKLMVDSSQWSRIDAWVSSHEAVDCPPPVGIADEPTWWSVGGDTNEEGTEYHLPIIILTLPCSSPETIYSLTIEDFYMQRTEAGWLIRDWGDANEDLYMQRKEDGWLIKEWGDVNQE